MPNNIIMADVPSGSGFEIFDYTSGSFTLEAPTSDAITIQHGLGRTPNVVMVFTKSNVVSDGKHYVGGVFVVGANRMGCQLYNEAGGSTHSPNVETGTLVGVSNVTATTFQVKGSTNYPFIGGVECVWYALAFKDGG